MIVLSRCGDGGTPFYQIFFKMLILILLLRIIFHSVVIRVGGPVDLRRLGSAVGTVGLTAVEAIRLHSFTAMVSPVSTCGSVLKMWSSTQFNIVQAFSGPT